MSTNTNAIQEKNSSPARSLQVVALKPPRRIPDLPLLQHDELPPREEVKVFCRLPTEMSTNTIAIQEKNSSPARSLVVAPRRIPDLPLLQHDELPPCEEVKVFYTSSTEMSTKTIAIQKKNSSPARSLVVALKPPRRIPDLPLLQHDELPPREEVNRCRDLDELVTGHY